MENTIRGVPVEVGNILEAPGIKIRVLDVPEKGNAFSAIVIEMQGGEGGYQSDIFNKNSWFKEDIKMTKSKTYRVGELVKNPQVTLIVTGPGYDSERFSGTVIELTDSYQGEMIVGTNRDNFLTDCFERTGDVVILQLPAPYPFNEGDMVMVAGAVDHYDYVIRVLKMDSQPAHPGEMFSGMIIDGNALAQDQLGEVREHFRINGFRAVTATYK